MCKKLVFSLASLVVLLLCLCFSASAEELPVMVGDQYYPDIPTALQAAGSAPVHVISDLHLNADIHMAGQTLYIDPGVTVYCDSYYIGVGEQSTFYLLGNLVALSSGFRITVGSDSALYISGSVYAPNNGFLLVYNPCYIEFNGAEVVCGDYAVSVREYALSSTILVNGGSFYSSTRSEPLSPLSAFTFPSGVDVMFQNGAVFAVSNTSVLGDIGRLVSSSVEWIHIFINEVSHSPLLLIFFIIVFSGLGIGLIKRLITI